MPAAGGCNGWTPQAPLLLVYAYRYLFPARLQDHIGKSHPEYSPRMAQRHTTPDTPAIALHPESHWSLGTRGTALSRQSSVPDSRYGPRNGPLYRQYRLHASALAFSLVKSASCKFRFVHETCTVRPRIVVPCCWLQILSSNGSPVQGPRIPEPGPCCPPLQAPVSQRQKSRCILWDWPALPRSLTEVFLAPLPPL